MRVYIFLCYTQNLVWAKDKPPYVWSQEFIACQNNIVAVESKLK